MRKKDTIRYILKIIFGFLLVVVIIMGAVKVGSVSYEFGYRIFTETAIDDAANGRDVQVEITDSMSLTDIADVLEEEGLVRNSNVFWLQVELSVYRNRLQAGTYTLSTSMTPKEMMQVLSGEYSQNSDESGE